MMQQFQIGQQVVVTRRCEDHALHGMGLNTPWMNVWENGMSEFIGKTLTIGLLPEGMFPDEGVAVKESEYVFPASVLMLVEQCEFA
jgi:hypothetical protein